MKGQEKDVDEKLEQVSDASEAALEKLSQLDKEIDEKLEQLSDRHASALTRITQLESSHND